MQNGVSISFPLSSAVDKLVTIAGGNMFLVVEAIRFMGRSTAITKRGGFLWLRRKTTIHEVADLDRVVEYIHNRMRRKAA